MASTISSGTSTPKHSKRMSIPHGMAKHPSLSGEVGPLFQYVSGSLRARCLYPRYPTISTVSCLGPFLDGSDVRAGGQGPGKVSGQPLIM